MRSGPQRVRVTPLRSSFSVHRFGELRRPAGRPSTVRVTLPWIRVGFDRIERHWTRRHPSGEFGDLASKQEDQNRALDGAGGDPFDGAAVEVELGAVVLDAG